MTSLHIQHAPGRRATVSRWRLICLVASGLLVVLGAAAGAAGILPGDVEVREELVDGTTARLYQIALWANYAGSWHGLLPGSVVLFLVSREARRHWWLWAAVLVSAPLLEFLVKRLVDRPRPNSHFPGFPSGHVTAITAFAVVCFYLAEREGASRTLRVALLAGLAAIVALVGLARLNLHAHWPSDLVGGLLLGTACASAAAWLHGARLGTEPRGQPRAAAGMTR